MTNSSLKINEEEDNDSFIDRGGIAGYLNRNYQNKTIGKEVTPYVQSGLQILGESYEDAMYKARRGLLGPHAFVGSHAIDTIGKIIPDIPLDKAISYGLHNWGGIDKPLADVGGEVGEMLATRKIIKGAPNVARKVAPVVGKGINKVKKSDLGTSISNIGKSPSQQTVNVKGVTVSKAESLNNAFPIDDTKLIKDFTSGSLRKNSLFSPNRVNPNFLFTEGTGKDIYRKYFDQIGLRPEVALDLEAMLYGSTPVTKHLSRVVKQGISNPDFGPLTKNQRRVIVDEFLSGLEFLGIAPDKVEIHHISTLRYTAALFDGLREEEWPEMMQMIMKSGIFTGNDPDNLAPLFKEVHRSGISNAERIRLGVTLPVHTYLNDKLGRHGDKLFGKNQELIKDLSAADRQTYLDHYAYFIKRSIQIQNYYNNKALDSYVYYNSPQAMADVVPHVPTVEEIQAQAKAQLDKLFGENVDPASTIGGQALIQSISGDESDVYTAGQTMKGVKNPNQLQIKSTTSNKNINRTNRNQQLYEKDKGDIKPESPFTDPGTLGPTGERDW